MPPAIPARGRTGRIAGRITGLAAMLLSGVWAGAATPQDRVGRSLTIGTDFGVVANDNLDLDPESEGSTVSATAGLDFTLRYARPLDTFVLSGDLGLRSSDGPESDDRTTDGPSSVDLRLDYDRAVRDSRFGVSGYLSRRQIAFLDLLDSDFPTAIDSDLDADLDTGLTDPTLGGLDDPRLLDDLDAVSQTGTRLSYGLDTTLELRRTAPFGVILSAGVASRRYSDTDAPDLEDDDRYRAGIGLRFDLDDITRGSLDLDYSTFEEDGDPRGQRDTVAVSTGLSRATPSGSVGLDLALVSTEDGDRYILEVNRNFDLALWSLSGSLGVTRSENGDLLPTGAVRASRELRQGRIAINLTRRVLSDGDDEERRVTGVSVDFSRPLTRLTSMGLDVSYVQSAATGEGATESLGSAGLTVRHALSEDWSLNLGLAHRIEDDGIQGRGRDNRVSLNLRRQVTFRP